MSLFAILGDPRKPKSFAGLFGLCGTHGRMRARDYRSIPRTPFVNCDVRMSDLPINRPLGRGRDPGAHDLNRICKAFGKQKQICVVS